MSLFADLSIITETYYNTCWGAGVCEGEESLPSELAVPGLVMDVIIPPPPPPLNATTPQKQPILNSIKSAKCTVKSSPYWTAAKAQDER